MNKIIKSEGTTKSERYLAKLCEDTFLKLWSYPNLYRDQGQKNGKGMGKELCDLLVVCGDNIIIFSDKSIEFSNTGNVTTDWIRWFKKAVWKSAKQLHGAERWLNSYPDRIFLDPLCTQKFPLELPLTETRKIIKIVVALNAGQRCREYCKGGSGGFLLFPGIKAEEHLDPSISDYSPFAIGDIDPDGGYIHVLDDFSLDFIMRELDTITDFVDYLLEKEKFIKNGYLGAASGEEQLLAYYLQNLDKNERHCMPFPPEEAEGREIDGIILPEGHWEKIVTLPQYVAKKAADHVSYFWDDLLNRLGQHALDGTLVDHGDGATVKDQEEIIRYMALENRVQRRVLANGILEAIDNAIPGKRYARVLMSGDDPEKAKGTQYIFLQLPAPKSDSEKDYEIYREHRRFFLWLYCGALLMDYPSFERVIGICIEPPKVKNSRFHSEDLHMREKNSIGEDEQEAITRERKEFRILEWGRMNRFDVHDEEFPNPEIVSGKVETDRPQGNRKERRKQAAMARKAKRKRRK